jgi:hypothetical protein
MSDWVWAIGGLLLFPIAAITVIWIGLALLYAAASIWDYAISTVDFLLWNSRTHGYLSKGWGWRRRFNLHDVDKPEFHRSRLTLWLEKNP